MERIQRERCAELCAWTGTGGDIRSAGCVRARMVDVDVRGGSLVCGVRKPVISARDLVGFVVRCGLDPVDGFIREKESVRS